MANGDGGFGQRGDVVHGRDDDESRRKIPLRIACTSALVLNLATVCLYFVGWTGRAQTWWNEYEPNAWIGPARAFWRRIAYVIEQTGAWGSPQMFLRLRPLALEWIGCLVLLFVFDQIPRILMAEGLLPFGQVNPSDGIRTSWGWMFHRGTQVLERVVEKPRFIRWNPRDTLRKIPFFKRDGDTTPAWVKESYRVIMALWGVERLTRKAFKDRLGIGGTRLYYKYVKGRPNHPAWFQQWGVIEPADKRGTWKWCKQLNDVLAVDPELKQYAQRQSPTLKEQTSGAVG